ncbi:MAG TPA: phosphotransferase [Dokdonella sp.]
MTRFAEREFAAAGLVIEPASADASFRSYWRATDSTGTTRVIMDAPPAQENIGPWLEIGSRLRSVGLHTPEVLAVDREQGFILMEDLGARAYLPELNAHTVDALYADALDALLRMQTKADPRALPVFDDAFLRMELELLPQWFLQRHLGLAIDGAERAVIDAAFSALIGTMRAQPQGFMHRDFHSRNLMLVEHAQSSGAADALPNPGIIDFQGAVIGPITYDIASLLRDCYIAWEPERVEGWLENYRQRAAGAHLIDAQVDAAQFRRWFDLTGLQRHLKVLGLFCRLWYRDGKVQYLADLPLVWRYVITVARSYHDLAPLADLLERALGTRDITQPAGAAA